MNLETQNMVKVIHGANDDLFEIAGTTVITNGDQQASCFQPHHHETDPIPRGLVFDRPTTPANGLKRMFGEACRYLHISHLGNINRLVGFY